MPHSYNPQSVTRNDSLIAQLRRELKSTPAFQRFLDAARIDITGLAAEARALTIATLQEVLTKRIAVIVPGDAAIEWVRDHYCSKAVESGPQQDWILEFGRGVAASETP